MTNRLYEGERENFANFLQYGSSSLTPYEAAKLATGVGIHTSPSRNSRMLRRTNATPERGHWIERGGDRGWR